MVVSKIVDLPDSSETGDDLVIPDMMFTQGKEPVGVRFLLTLNHFSPDFSQTVLLSVN